MSEYEIITDPEVIRNTDEPDSWLRVCFTCGRPESDYCCIEPTS